MERKIVGRILAGTRDRRITRELHVRRQRVQRLRILAEEYGYLDGSVALPAYPQALFEEKPDGRAPRVSEAELLLTELRSWIEERLSAGWHPITVFEELTIPVSRSSDDTFTRGPYSARRVLRPCTPQ